VQLEKGKCLPIPASAQYRAFSPRHHFRVMESCSTLLSTEVLCHTVPREIAFRLPLRHNPSHGLQFLFDIQRELNHALRHLFGRLTSKVLKHQLLNIEPHKITQQGARDCAWRKQNRDAINRDEQRRTKLNASTKFCALSDQLYQTNHSVHTQRVAEGKRH
jgi:hypothetical protein